MTNHSIFAAGLALACALLGSLVICSCNSKPADVTKTDTTQVGGQSTSPTTVTATPILYLSSLTVSAEAIRANPNVNIMFVYYNSSPVWKLRGWLFENNGGVADVFSPNPDMVLEPDGKIRLPIRTNTYLSNLVLTRTDEKKIYNLIRNKLAKLHFEPTYNAATRNVSYEITIEIIKKGESIFLADKFSANPCPPHCASK